MKIPTDICPCMTIAEPRRRLTMAAATAATGVSGATVNTSAVMISASSTIVPSATRHPCRSRRPSAALAPTSSSSGSPTAEDASSQVHVDLSPQCARPRAQAWPVAPDLHRGFVGRRRGFVGRHLVGHALQGRQGSEEPLRDIIHQWPSSRRGQPET
jgi:hypothetical protein